jgi:pilus assembly protein CpaF
MTQEPQPQPGSPNLERLKSYLCTALSQQLDGTESAAGGYRQQAIKRLEQIVTRLKVELPDEVRESIFKYVLDEVVGYGPIQPFLDDPLISEIMINGPDDIYVERLGEILETEASFESEDQLMRVINRMVLPLGRRIDWDTPMVDARLPDGSRINVIIPPVCTTFPCLTIRKFLLNTISMDDLIMLDALTPNMAEFLQACVGARLNILVSGPTSSGKTTLLNLLSSFIPEKERIITIEDAAELQLKQKHVISLETRAPDMDGKGGVTARDLVRNTLRMRPDRIIVGEVRGPEALDMLQAMNTGHNGSITTLHANSPRDAISRLETMVLMAGIELPLIAIRRQIASALNLVVHLNRLTDGSRKITYITEITGMESDVISMMDIFKFEQTGVDAEGKILGRLAPTGIRPMFSHRLEVVGFKLGSKLFGPGITSTTPERVSPGKR